MVGLTNLEVYNSMYIITEDNIKFKVHLFPKSTNVRIAFANVRDDIGKNLEVSKITVTDVQDEILGPIFMKNIEKSIEKNEK